MSPLGVVEPSRISAKHGAVRAVTSYLKAILERYWAHDIKVTLDEKLIHLRSSRHLELIAEGDGSENIGGSH